MQVSASRCGCPTLCVSVEPCSDPAIIASEAERMPNTRAGALVLDTSPNVASASENVATMGICLV